MNTDDQNHPGRNEPGRSALEITALERREIQSPLIASLLRGFIGEIGYDKAMGIASTVIQNDAIEVGKRMAGKYGGNTMKDLLRVIKETWAAENALEFTVLEETDQRLSFDVTRCRYAELYARLGIKEFGGCLSCDRDAPLIESFNPRMKLLRTQTIMQGAALCDFRITME